MAEARLDDISVSMMVLRDQTDTLRNDLDVTLANAASAVPEPSTLAGVLLGAALIGGEWLRRRRQAA